MKERLKEAESASRGQASGAHAMALSKEVQGGKDEGDFWLGEVLVQRKLRTLIVGGQARQLDHKAMQVLVCLTQAAGGTVGKEAIFAAVWPGAHVTDDVLTAAISRLRRALGDQAKRPRFIETVPTVGYRLLAPARPAQRSESPALAGRARTGTATRHLHGVPNLRRWLLPSSLLLLGVLVLMLEAMRSGEPSTAEATGDAGADTQVLAVKPLANLTGTADQDYLAAAMTDALVTGLASQEGLRVLPRWRDFASGAGASARGAAPGGIAGAEPVRHEQAARVLIEGSVQRSNDQLRVSLRLIAAQGGRHLWARTFEGRLDRAFELQERMVAAITNELVGAQGIVSAGAEALPASTDAYESYLRSRYLMGQEPTRHRLARAERHLRRCLQLEPSFAPAYLALAEVSLTQGREMYIEPELAFTRVRGWVRQAQSLGSSELARAEALLAMVQLLYDWDLVAAERGFQRALALDPKQALAREGYSQLLTVSGRFPAALAQQRVLRELDPLVFRLPHRAYIHNMARQHHQALAELQEQMSLERRSARLYSHLASTYRWLGRPAEALAPFLTSLRLRSARIGDVQGLRGSFQRAGVAGVGRFLQAHHRRIESAGQSLPAVVKAEAHVLAGDWDLAMEQLEAAVERREPGILVIAQSPDYDPLRRAPRFRNILRKLGLEDA